MAPPWGVGPPGPLLVLALGSLWGLGLFCCNEGTGLGETSGLRWRGHLLAVGFSESPT